MENKVFTIRNVYLYLVSFVTLVIFIFSMISAVRNLMDIIIQDQDIEYKYEMLVEDTKDELYNDEYKEIREKENRIRNIKRVVTNIASLIISGGFWIYHWRKIESEDNIIKV